MDIEIAAQGNSEDRNTTPIDQPEKLGLVWDPVLWRKLSNTLTGLRSLTQLRGRYPKIFEDKVYGQQARELYADAQRLVEQIVGGTLHCRGVRLVACQQYR